MISLKCWLVTHGCVITTWSSGGFDIVVRNSRMRKCPNCHKNVPAGAKRCVYCRSLVKKEKVMHQQKQTDDPESDAASHTMLNIASSAIHQNKEASHSSTTHDDSQDINDHTLLGFGASASLGSQRQLRSDNSKDQMQSTMLGMPGVAGLGRDIDLNSPVLGLNHPGVKTKTPPQSIKINNTTTTPPPPEQHQTSEETEEIDSDDFDPLAGLVVFSPKVSSLIDEEFDDISTDILGFNIDDTELEDTDNDWLDIKPVPSKTKQNANDTSDSAPISQTTKQTDKKEAPQTTNQDVKNPQLDVSSVKELDVSPVKAEEKTTQAENKLSESKSESKTEENNTAK